MFAGKTTRLMTLLGVHAQRGERWLAIKHARDTRYHATALATHDGRTIEALAIDDVQELHRAAQDAHVIAIDEAHFFGDPLAPVCLALVRAGRQVLIAGIELDHYGDPFEPFPTLLSHADEVLKLSAPCAVCGGVGVHTQRMVAGESGGGAGGRVVVGGAESYQTRCRRCFQPASRVRG
jgi:thymidine kinase